MTPHADAFVELYHVAVGWKDQVVAAATMVETP